MPKPDKHVFVCVQNRPPGHPRGSCGEKSSMKVIEAFMTEVQQRNLYEKIAVTNTGCIGPCGMGPSVLVYPDGVMYGNVSESDVKEIVDQHLLGDQPVERLLMPEHVWG